MPSLRARFFNAMIRSTLRKQRWGRDEHELAARARRKFGAPGIVQWLAVRGLGIIPATEGPGEWIVPKDAAARALIFYIHGGGFVSCSPRTHRPITAALASKTGMLVFSADYRLAPEHPFPAGLDDVYATYLELTRMEPNARVAVAGDSAGGGLVMSLLLRIRDEGLAPPACAVCFSPWTNLTPRDPECENARADAMFYPQNTGEFAAAYIGSASASDPDISPVFGDYNDLPPILFQVSSTEILIDDSRRVHEKIKAAGGVSELRIFDDLSHCWQMLNWFVPEAGQALDQAAAFISRHVES
jgi:epsilon-lactone hydrolase